MIVWKEGVENGKVGLAKGNQSYDAVRKSLDLISDEISVPSDLPVVIKTNLVAPKPELGNTPVTTVEAIMDFLTERGVKKFVVAEGTTHQATMSTFERYGYFSLKDKYDVELRDLNEDDHIKFELFGLKGKPAVVRLARSFMDCYLISVARMKCHNWVGATLTLKNLAMGFILDPYRDPRHTGFVCHNYENINRSIARLAQVIVPNLAVADGVIGMEGDGPGKGTPIESGIALAGTNALAVDLIGARLMGFDPRTIGYLWYLSKLKDLSPEQIQVVGEDVSQCITKYKAPNNYPKVLGWWAENWRESVEGDYRIPSE